MIMHAATVVSFLLNFIVMFKKQYAYAMVELLGNSLRFRRQNAVFSVSDLAIYKLLFAWMSWYPPYLLSLLLI